MDTAFVVFTHDLRLHDSPALHLACARARRVVPAFVVDPAIAAPPNRARFLAESLADLRASLRERGGDLVIRDGDPAAEVIPATARITMTWTRPPGSAPTSGSAACRRSRWRSARWTARAARSTVGSSPGGTSSSR